jgi:hypothetical protein
MRTLPIAALAILMGLAGVVEARDQGYGGGSVYGNSGNQRSSSGSNSGSYGSPGEHSVSGHTRRDGTYVQPHQQTNSNDTKLDNWSTKGNTNPYTGREGTVDPYKPYGR